MEHDGLVIEHQECPRCHSTAPIQAYVKENTDIVVLMLRCKQCRLERTKGFTTERGISLLLGERKLQRALSEAETPQRVYEIEQKLLAIGRLKARYSLGL